MLGESLKQMLVDSGGWLENGHFVFTGGRHSDTYVNKDALYPHTAYASKLGAAMAEASAPWDPEVAVSPATGGIVLTQWTAHHLSRLLSRDVLAVYAEKADGGFRLTRGYDQLVHGRRIVVLEDNLTTGGSVRRVSDVVRANGGEIVGVVAMLNRGGVLAQDVGSPPHFTALIEANLPSWPADQCKLCQTGVAINQSVGKGKLARE